MKSPCAICGGAGFTENFETMTISGVCPECGLAPAAIEQNENLKYILKFLSNGGEEIRAIRLVMDLTTLKAFEAREYIRGIKIPPSSCALSEAAKNEWDHSHFSRLRWGEM